VPGKVDLDLFLLFEGETLEEEFINSLALCNKLAEEFLPLD
jgi:hypothetical protein